jgi:hypothetical protein
LPFTAIKSDVRRTNNAALLLLLLLLLRLSTQRHLLLDIRRRLSTGNLVACRLRRCCRRCCAVELVAY